MLAWRQVMTEGDALVDCAISSTGEAIAFGGSGGYAHLWSSASAQQLVTVNRFSEVLCSPSGWAQGWHPRDARHTPMLVMYSPHGHF